MNNIGTNQEVREFPLAPRQIACLDQQSRENFVMSLNFNTVSDRYDMIVKSIEWNNKTKAEKCVQRIKQFGDLFNPANIPCNLAILGVKVFSCIGTKIKEKKTEEKIDLVLSSVPEDLKGAFAVKKANENDGGY
jgi:hypothetical protein